MSTSALTPDQIAHYQRQLLLPEMGVRGQKRLHQASVLIIGMGGLGCPIALYLAAAGVGQLGLIDFDCIEQSNLHRQILFNYDDLHQPKAEVAAKKLKRLNPHITIQHYNERLSAENALTHFSRFDYIIDGSDNFTTRYLVNDACVLSKKVCVFGSILRFEGRVSVFCHSEGPCYRCLFPKPPQANSIPNCAQAGVLGVLPGMIGTVQACETIKLILQQPHTLVGTLLTLDARNMSWNSLRIKKNPHCPVCGDNPHIHTLHEDSISCEAPLTLHPEIKDWTAKEVQLFLKNHRDTCVLIDVRTDEEYQIAHINGALSIPLPNIEQSVEPLNTYRDKTIIAYCQSGHRSSQALNLMKNAGFESLINLKSGFQQWELTNEVPLT